MAKRQHKKSKTLRELDGALCLSFVNTASEKRQAPRDYPGLLLWLEGQGASGTNEVGRFRALAAENPAQAAQVLASASELRGLLREIFNEVVDRRQVSPSLMDAFNVHLVRTLPRQVLVPTDGIRFRWGWVEGHEDDLGRPLWAVVSSAARLFASDDVGRCRRCAGEGCDLLFVARNSGSPRRWCNMKDCGTRANSQRHYHKTTKPEREARRALSPQEKAEKNRRLAEMLLEFDRIKLSE